MKNQQSDSMTSSQDGKKSKEKSTMATAKKCEAMEGIIVEAGELIES